MRGADMTSGQIEYREPANSTPPGSLAAFSELTGPRHETRETLEHHTATVEFRSSIEHHRMGGFCVASTIVPHAAIPLRLMTALEEEVC